MTGVFIVLLEPIVADRSAEILAYLSSRPGMSTLLLGLVGGYSLARYWSGLKSSERRYGDLLWGGTLTAVAIAMILMLSDSAWDIVGIFVGVFVGLFGSIRLIWDSYGMIRGPARPEKRKLAVDCVLLLTGLTHGWLLLSALARPAP